MGNTGEMTVEKRRGFLWINLPSSITVDNCRIIETKLAAKLSGSGDRVVLDMSNMEHLYSSGIGLIIRLRKQVCDTGGSLVLVNVSKKLRAVFESMNLEKILQVYATDVEFEISHEDAWSETLSDEGIGFVFIAQVENGMHRLSFAGCMDALHDLSGVSEFTPDRSHAQYILNMENLDAMDTYGSQVFLDLVQRIGKLGGTCITFGANDMIHHLFSLLSIDRFVRHFDSEKEALAAAGA